MCAHIGTCVCIVGDFTIQQTPSYVWDFNQRQKAGEKVTFLQVRVQVP